MRFVFLLGLCCFAYQSQASVVLLTYFESYRPGRVNLSQNVAVQTKKKLAHLRSDVKIHLCQVPVIFDKADEAVKECLAQLGEKPLFVLSLGEGGCRLQLETAARNLDNHGPDAVGVIRKGRSILPGGPMWLGFQFPVHELYCSLSTNEKWLVDISIDAGGFVCNHMSYRLSLDFAQRQLPFTFIHVPPRECAVGNVETSARLIAKMVGGVLHRTEEKGSDLHSPHIQNGIRMPVSDEEAFSLLRGLSAEAEVVGHCQREFFKVLSQKLRKR